ncbi:MAG: DUF2079 domain-containing protein [Candidatus Freyarchaeota archaeon]|nr:DUF2079 domain-containing protein [Candidatus Jordarchaeia archaeon]
MRYRALRSRPPLLLPLLFSATYSASFTFLSFTNHFAFRTLAGDLGIFNQALYSTLNFGLLFYDVIELGSHFQFHLDPILFLLLPIYSFSQTPLLLLAVQSVALGFSAVPAFLFSRETLRSDKLSLLLTLCYLLNPSLHGVNLYDFHPDCFLPILFFSSLLFIKRKQFLKSTLCILLALMCKEVAAFAAVPIGLYVVWLHRREIPWLSLLKLRLKDVFSNVYLVFAAVTVVLGGVWFILQQALFPPILAANRHALPWIYLGIGVGEVVRNFLVNPVGSLQAAFTPSIVKFALFKLCYGKYLIDEAIFALAFMEPSLKVNYLLLLFFPFAFLSLLSPATLLPAMPWIILSVTSTDLMHYNAINVQYPALILPFIFASSVHGLENLADKLENLTDLAQKVASKVKFAWKLEVSLKRSQISLCLVLIVLSCSFMSFYNYSVARVAWQVGVVTPRDQLLESLLSSIPPYFTISTQSNLFPHLTPTMNLYMEHYSFMPESYYDLVIVDTHSQWYHLRGVGGIDLFYELLPSSKLISELLSSGNYTILFQFDGIMIIGKS